MMASSSSSLTRRSGSTSGAASGGEKAAAQAGGQRGLPAGQIGHGGPWRGQIRRTSTPGCAASHCTAATAGEPETICTWAACDFFGGLRCVAAVGKQARGPARDGQSGAGAGESGEIANVGKMGDQQAREVRPGSVGGAIARCGEKWSTG